MTALRPDQFEQTVAQTRRGIDRRLDTLIVEYRKAYGAAHDRIVRDSSGRVTAGSHSDPTASITGDPLDPQRPGIQASIRRQLERAPKRLAEAESMVASIEPQITSAMDRLDPRERFEAVRYPITASHADLEGSHAAQQRRAERGED